MSSELKPHDQWPTHLHPHSEALLEASNECIAMRRQLDLEVADSVGDLYLACCREASSMGDAHRRGPRKLAEWLLGQLTSNSQ